MKKRERYVKRVLYTYTNATWRYTIDRFDAVPDHKQTTGELYKSCLGAFGRCTGKIYAEGTRPVDKYLPDKEVGWVFQSRQKYNDGGTYLQEVWVTYLLED